MPIDFHAHHNRLSYATRQADLTWRENIQHHIIDVRDKTVVDIGCGGGIYTLALAEMGAAHVTGVDFSQVEITSAQERYAAISNITFTVGNAFSTGLQSTQYDILLERALIHHLQQEDLARCFVEARRILKPGGMLIVQNRTPEDCVLPGSESLPTRCPPPPHLRAQSIAAPTVCLFLQAGLLKATSDPYRDYPSLTTSACGC